MSRKWLISFRYKAVHRFRSGNTDVSEACYAVQVIDVHPAVFLADAAAQLLYVQNDEEGRAAEDGEILRADRIEAVFLAMPLEHGVLTPEQEDLLR